MYICICAWTVFPGHLSATQIHSRVQVHNKQMSSTGLVYVCGFFSLWGCFVLSYKGEICWQVKWEVHHWTFFLFRSYALSGSRSGGLAYLTYPRSQCCLVRVCFCELSLWGSNRFCHLSGCELVTCLGSPTDVPYGEKVPAGFPNCALAMHGI